MKIRNKRIWPNFPIKLGKYTLTNVPHAKKEVTTLKELILCTWMTKGHDPKKVVFNHYKTLKMIPLFNMKKKKRRYFSRG
jgi:hypothetical protein